MLYLPQPIASPYFVYKKKEYNKPIYETCKCDMCTYTNKLKQEGKI